MILIRPKLIITILILIIGIWLGGCAGEQKNIKKDTNKNQSKEETSRDRTPTTPQVNIPTHSF
jgi:hypothetical protein